MTKKKLEKYLVGAIKRHGRIKVVMSRYGRVDRERVLTKSSCVVRLSYGGGYRHQWSRYERSCFVDDLCYDGLKRTPATIVRYMLEHDGGRLKCAEVRAGEGFKRVLRRFRKVKYL